MLALLMACGLAALAPPPGGVAAAPSDRDPVAVGLLASARQVAPQQPFEVAVVFTMAPGWHIYWRYPGFAGEPPSVAWSLPAGAQVGDWQWPTPEALPVGDLVSYGYTDTVALPATMTPPPGIAMPGQSFAATAQVAYMACRNICRPGHATLTLSLPQAAHPEADADSAAPLAAARARLPGAPPPSWRLAGEEAAAGWSLAVEAPAGTFPAATAGRFFPQGAGILAETTPQRLEVARDGARLRLHLAAAPPSARAVLLSAPPRRGVLHLAPPGDHGPIDLAVDLPPAAAAPAGAWSLASAMLLAFLGGVLLNLMPCVFPLLGVKVVGLLAQGDDPGGRRRHAAGYALGVMTSMAGLGALILALRAAGRQVGWGFQLQSPATVMALTGGLFVLALSMLGVGQLGTGLMAAAGGRRAGADFAGALGTGVLATVVAAPCSAPLMGSAVGFALLQPPAVALAVLGLVGVGLALPYVALCAWPPLARRLPRPGAWMHTLERTMGFALMTAVVWLATILGRQTGVAGLADLHLMALALAAVMALRAGWPTARRLQAATLALAAVVVAGGAARADEHAKVARRAQAGHRPADEAAACAPPAAGGPERGGAAEIVWEAWSPNRLAELQRARRRVLVDFTAAWCVSCQLNERWVLSRGDVRARIEAGGVTCLRADWTDADPRITAALAELGRAGVPLVVLYGSDPTVPPRLLPEVLTPGTLLAALETLP